jgi:hypothetical protein
MRVCHAACPEHGHWCIESASPHLEHGSEICRCRWDSRGEIVTYSEEESEVVWRGRRPEIGELPNLEEEPSQ